MTKRQNQRRVKRMAQQSNGNGRWKNAISDFAGIGFISTGVGLVVSNPTDIVNVLSGFGIAVVGFGIAVFKYFTRD